MGNDASKASRPPWQDREGHNYPPDIVEEIRHLSYTADTFLKPHPDFHLEDFDIEDYGDELEAAIDSDSRLAQWLPKLVPKRLDEYAFWRNYFSHVYVLKKRGDAMLAAEAAAAAAAPLSTGAVAEAHLPLTTAATVPTPTPVVAAESVTTSAATAPAPTTVSTVPQSEADFDEAVQQFLSEPDIAAKERQSSPMIRWGIIGAGNVCEVKSGPALQDAIGSTVTAVQRRDADAAKDFAERHSVAKWYSDASQLINDASVDAVYVATPPDSHRELAEMVAAAGKPCLVEKPLARSFEESYALVEAFRLASTPLFVAYYRRRLPRFVLAKHLISKGHLGVITSVTYRLCRSDHIDGREIGWRADASIAGGGLFVDLGSHVLDILDYLLGPFRNVSGDASRSPAAPTTTAVESSVSMRFSAGGAQGTALFDFCSGVYEDELIVRGSEARLRMSVFGRESLDVRGASGWRRELEVPHPLQHVHQPLVQSVVDELRGVSGAQPCPSRPDNALRTARVIDTVLRGFYRDRTDHFWTRPHTWRI